MQGLIEQAAVYNLLKLGTPRQHAFSMGLSRKGCRRLSRTLATQTGMTNECLAQQGLLSIRDLWMKAQGYDEKPANSSAVRLRTAHCGAARWVVWKGGFVRILPIPIMLLSQKCISSIITNLYQTPGI
jgi:hypothetical protein